MTPERYQQINQICEAALDLPPGEQRAYVRQACGADNELRQEVESLLQFQSNLDDFLDMPAMEVAARQVASDAVTQPAAAPGTNPQATRTNPQATHTNLAAEHLASVRRGVVLNERYKLERELGHGGFGAVWLARDQKLHETSVVVKVLHEGSVRRTDGPWFERKFKEEIRALAQIDHPGVVRALDVGELADGRAFLVMQHVDGVTLRSLLQAEPMELPRIVHLLRQIGQALTAAHRQGVVHRDLKPENIMVQLVGEEEYARLIDFGIATVLDSANSGAGADASVENTRVVGTHRYMAPEQFQGKPVAASDIYALGVIAYEMVTGRCPFQTDSLLLQLEQQHAETYVRPRTLRPELPIGVEVAIKKALSYAPEARFVQAKEFAEAFAQGTQESVTVADPILVTTPAPSARWLPWLVGTLICTVGLFFVWAGFFRSPATPPLIAPSVVAKRELHYTLRLQKDRASKPFFLMGETFAVAGTRLQLLISSPQDGYLYVVNEGPQTTNGLANYIVMFPEATTSTISAAVQANQTVQLPQPSAKPENDWFKFDQETGTETLWLVWSETAIPVLEAVKHLANPRDEGIIRQPEQITALQSFFAAQARQKATIEKDDANKQTRLSISGALLVQSLRFEHQ